jgi:hypothetical protein
MTCTSQLLCSSMRGSDLWLTSLTLQVRSAALLVLEQDAALHWLIHVWSKAPRGEPPWSLLLRPGGAPGLANDPLLQTYLSNIADALREQQVLATVHTHSPVHVAGVLQHMNPSHGPSASLPPAPSSQPQSPMQSVSVVTCQANGPCRSRSCPFCP